MTIIPVSPEEQFIPGTLENDICGIVERGIDLDIVDEY